MYVARMPDYLAVSNTVIKPQDIDIATNYSYLTAKNYCSKYLTVTL